MPAIASESIRGFHSWKLQAMGRLANEKASYAARSKCSRILIRADFAN
jgi:hypothetical protein